MPRRSANRHQGEPKTTNPKKIILATAGTLGDLHPFIAIGLALKNRGLAPVLAVPEDQVGKCRRAGLQATGILPGLQSIIQRMGLSESEAVGRIMANQRVMLEQVLLPGLSDCTEALDALATDAHAIVASIFVFAAPIVAEKRGLPLVSVILQPMAMLSAYDPPRTRDFWMMLRPPVSRIGRAWNRAGYAALRWVLDRLYGRRLDRVRAEQGLPSAGAKHLLEPPPSSVLCLGCYSPELGALPPDTAATTRIVGFPMFDSESGEEEALDPVLANFIAAGPPPLVFTLGTFAVSGAGDFYDKAAKIARRLNTRAVLLVGGDSAPTVESDVLRCGYAPHSLLFPMASLVVHHGGVGTTGQSLRTGKPQLVVPHMGDQNDHADRIVRMGTGLSLKASRFTVKRASNLISTILGSSSYRTTAELTARRMADEQGAEAAAEEIIRALSVNALGQAPIF